MTRKKSNYLDDYIIDQFPIEKFKSMIYTFINLIETFQMMLGDKDYYTKITPKYEMRIGNNMMPMNSKIESFLINQYEDNRKKELCIIKYCFAYNTLNDMEKRVFYSTFIDGKKDFEISEELSVYPILLNKIRKSAIVRFSLILGFDKLIDLF